MRLEAVLSRIEGTRSGFTELLHYEVGASGAAMYDDTREVSNYITALDHGLARLRSGFPPSDRPLVTTRRVELDVGVTNPTAQPAIDALVERGTLEETTGRKRGRVSFAPDIYKAVYADVPAAEAVDEEDADI